MHWVKPGDHHRTGEIDDEHNDECSDCPGQGGEETGANPCTNNASGTDDIVVFWPSLEKPILVFQQAAGREHYQSKTDQSSCGGACAKEKFGSPEPYEARRDQVTGSTKDIVGETCSNSTEATDKVINRGVGFGKPPEGNPGRKVIGIEGNQCKKIEQTTAQQNHTDDLTMTRVVALRPGFFPVPLCVRHPVFLKNDQTK